MSRKSRGVIFADKKTLRECSATSHSAYNIVLPVWSIQVYSGQFQDYLGLCRDYLGRFWNCSELFRDWSELFWDYFITIPH